MRDAAGRGQLPDVLRGHPDLGHPVPDVDGVHALVGRAHTRLARVPVTYAAVVEFLAGRRLGAAHVARPPRQRVHAPEQVLARTRHRALRHLREPDASVGARDGDDLAEREVVVCRKHVVRTRLPLGRDLVPHRPARGVHGPHVLEHADKVKVLFDRLLRRLLLDVVRRGLLLPSGRLLLRLRQRQPGHRLVEGDWHVLLVKLIV
mmetsp:Transcript_41809/g.99027  ORF Transcript_41809/g.99027 Transcript_41809/m.99027 type:complete len:205 (-) Transcript_41809:378-992(-)